MSHPLHMVHVIDDDAALREALQDLLASVALPVTLYPSAQAFLDAARPEVPSVLVTDVRMPGMGGMDLLAQMAGQGAEGPRIDMPVIVMTAHGDIAMGVQAMKRGAIDFLTKPFRDQDLLDAVQRGLDADRQRRDAAARQARHLAQWQALTPGEREVARLVVRGLLNKQIAGELGLSEITIKVRRAQVMRKLGARTLADLVRLVDAAGDA